MTVRLACALLACVLTACAGGTGKSTGVPVTYTLEHEPNNSPAQAQDTGTGFPLEVSGDTAAVGKTNLLATGDPDFYRFAAPAAGRLALTLSIPANVDYDLALQDENGLRLATSRADNLVGFVGPVERLYADTAAGVSYLIQVAGYAGGPGSYALRIEFSTDPAPGAVLGPGTTTTALGAMSQARSFHGLALLPDGGALVAGGTTTASDPVSALGAAIQTTERFVPAANSFTAGPDMSVSRFGLTATALPDGLVLLAGGDMVSFGVGNSTADLYDPRTGTLVAGAISMTGGGMRVLHSASLLPDGRVLLAGGVKVAGFPPTQQNLATSVIFDPKTRLFTPGPPLKAQRISHAAVGLADGRVLLVGGQGLSDTEIVDLRSGAFTSTQGPALKQVRDDATATRLADGRILVTGGQDGPGRSLDTAEILDDPAASAGSAFRLLTSLMSSHRSDQVAIPLPGGQVLILGGEDDPGTGAADTVLDTAEVFDPVSESFTSLPKLAAPRDDHRAVRLPDGRILVTGGEDKNTNSITDVEAYFPR